MWIVDGMNDHKCARLPFWQALPSLSWGRPWVNEAHHVMDLSQLLKLAAWVIIESTLGASSWMALNADHQYHMAGPMVSLWKPRDAHAGVIMEVLMNHSSLSGSKHNDPVGFPQQHGYQQ